LKKYFNPKTLMPLRGTHLAEAYSPAYEKENINAPARHTGKCQ